MITVNPSLTTSAAGTFSVSLDGLMQGMAMDDPAVRNQLTGGPFVPGADTIPMFGGVPIAENFPAAPPAGVIPRDSSLGLSISRATTPYVGAGPSIATSMAGVSVFNQNHAMVNSPQSPVPQASAGMLVNYYRFGSRARIAMALDPASVTAGIPSGPLLYWVAASQWISLAAAGGILLPPTCRVLGASIGNAMTVAYNAGTGFCTWVRNGNAILIEI